MKKNISMGLIALSLVTMTPHESNAVVGVSTGGTGLIVAGAILGTSCSAALISTSEKKIARSLTGLGIPCLVPGAILGLGFSGDPSSGMIAGAYLGAITGAVAGVVLLDEKGTFAKFSEIDQDLADKLDMSVAERTSFNSDLDQLNLIVEDIQSKVQDLVEKQEIVALTQILWTEASEALSPETQLAMAKLGQTL